MDQPQIQYAKTEDGVNIAYWTLGEGEAIVHMPPLIASHVQLEWEREATAEFYGRLARYHMLVRYDCRAAGLSDRDITDYSVAGQIKDLTAVVDAIGLETFALYAPYRSGAVAVTYATQHPERVSHLLLRNSHAQPKVVAEQVDFEAARPLIQQDWELFLKTYANIAMDWAEGEFSNRAADFMAQSTTAEAFLAFDAALADVDVTPILQDVRAPTLVMQTVGREGGRTLAAGIPGARLAPISDGSEEANYAEAARLTEDFLGGDREPSASDQAAGPSTHTILFTDMVSSTTLADQLGDAAAQEVRRAHNDIVRAALNASGGSEIKHTGDGIMASFSTASSALDAAIAIQRGVAEHKNANPDSPLGVYVGLNAGEPIAEDDDLFGTSINLAARICDHAEAGQILVANVVRELAAGKDFLFSDLGETELRGFEDPVKLWELRWQDEG